MTQTKLDNEFEEILNKISDLTPLEHNHSVLIFKEKLDRTIYYFYGLKDNNSLI